jgi:hypothetical protein
MGNTPHDMPKHMKRALRDVATEAYEEELRRALLPLADAFEKWRAGQLDSGGLTALVHKFHDGAARDLFKKYNYGPLHLAVAEAIVSGALDRSRVPQELLEALERAIAFYEEQERR